MTQSHRLTKRTGLVAMLIALPAVLVAFGITGVEMWRWRHANSPLFRTTSEATLADAIAAGDVKGAYEFLRAGQDPNGVIAVRDPALTRGRPAFVPPLMWAVATQRRDAVSMLLAFGARVDSAPGNAAACLADSLNNAEIANLLRSTSPAMLPSDQCTAPQDSSTPLLEILQQTASTTP